MSRSFGGAGGPSLELSASASFCHYQQLATFARALREGRGADVSPGWEAPARRVARSFLPLGALNLLEPALLPPEDASGAGAALRSRAETLAEALAGALAETEAAYRRELWPGHAAAVRDALAEVAPALDRHADALLRALQERLAVSRTPSPYLVALVPVCHEPAGAYSHPTVVSVARFRGLALVEAILHELGHVLAELNRDDPRSFVAVARAAAAEGGHPPAVALRAVHLLLFESAGELVRQHCDPDHVAHLDRQPRVGRALAGDPARLERMRAAWRERLEGRASLEAAIAAVLAA